MFELPYEYTKTLEFNQYKTFYEEPFVIYADPMSLIEKTDRCKNNPERWSTRKVGEHIPSDFSMSAILSFECIENNVYRLMIAWKSCVNL